MSRARVVKLAKLVSYQQQQGMQQRACSELAASKGTAPNTGDRVNALSSLPSVPLKPASLLLVHLIRLIHRATNDSGEGVAQSLEPISIGPIAQPFFHGDVSGKRGGVTR